MTSVSSRDGREVAPPAQSSLWRRLPGWLRSVALSVPQLLLAAAAFIPSIIDNQETLTAAERTNLNVLLLVVAFSLAAYLSVLTAVREREKQSLERRIAMIDSSRWLDKVTAELFRSGGWRLSLFTLDGSKLTRRDSVAQHEHWKRGVAPEIALLQSPFNSLFERNLSGDHDRLYDESPPWGGDASTPAGKSQWLAWRASIFGEGALPALDSGSMVPRKFAWYAIHDPDSHLVWAVICESMAGSGINVEFLAKRETAVWVLLWARMIQAAGK